MIDTLILVFIQDETQNGQKEGYWKIFPRKFFRLYSY